MSNQTSLHVARAVAGDHDSIGWIVEHFRGLVEAQVRLRVRGHGNAADIEDLAAEVWCVVVQRLPELMPREGRHTPVLVKFLGTTVLGTCNNFLRSRARNAARFRAGGAAGEDRPSLDPMAALPAMTRGVMTRVLHKEDRNAVEQCLHALPEDQRDVLVLRLMEHRTNQEIGDLLSLPANTIAVRYKRALEALRQRLPSEFCAELTAAG